MFKWRKFTRLKAIIDKGARLLKEWLYKYSYNRTKPVDLAGIDGDFYLECYSSINANSWEYKYKYKWRNDYEI
jgi:hypothetical protein